jgi:hypothetical protein
MCMQGKALTYLPPLWEDWVLKSSWSFWQASEGILGLTWIRKKSIEKEQKPVIEVVFINCETGESKHNDSFQWQNGSDVKHLQIRPGDAQDKWILTWDGFPTQQPPRNTLLCPVQWNVPLSSSTIMQIDQAFDEMSSVGSVIFATITGETASVVHLEPGIGDAEPTFISVNHIIINRNEELEENTIEWALKATVNIQENKWYLAMFDAEWAYSEEVMSKTLREIRREATGPSKSRLFTRQAIKRPLSPNTLAFSSDPLWRFWIAGGNLPLSAPTWEYRLRIGIPADSDPYANFDEEVIVGSVIIAGPRLTRESQDEQQTIIVAAGLIKKEALGLPEEQARPLRGGELICLCQDGLVVQECKEEIVEQVELCLVGDVVIGVDRIQRRWRLWRWEPLAGKEQFSTVQWLDEEVVHAHVVTNHENSDPQGTHFWLVEERPEGLKVSRCAGQTLEETEESLVLEHYSLPYSLERSVGHWDWPVKKGLIGHEDALLLIAADEQNRVVLYRVEAGKA